MNICPVVPSNFPLRGGVQTLRGLALALLVLLTASCGDSGRQAMVSTANPYASEAALDILKQGGSAVDAAIAAQLVLTLVEPQSSGIGGGAFMLHWDEGADRVDAYDGRETAPAAAGPDLFLHDDGTPMGFMEAVVGGRAVGVPGVVALLWEAHQDHGRLDWEDVLAPAIRLAETGFKVSQRLHDMIASHNTLTGSPTTRPYFYIESVEVPGAWEPLPVGFVRKNQAYADTLRRIAGDGPAGFYQGEVADAIVAAVTSHDNAGLMTLEDLGAYEAKRREALCRPYRDHEVCGMPPPTSGGLTTLMILGMLQTFDLSALRPGSPMAVHLISEASKLAYADRAIYMADADFVDVPVNDLLRPGYLDERALLIHPGQSMGKARPGEFEAPSPTQQAADEAHGRPSTSHFAIVDRWGDAVSMTTSVEGPFGAHIMAGGFILNNQLTDFSFQPVINGREVANAVAGGKRPRSSMSPTLIFDDNGRFYAALGSPGGSRIITFVLQSIVALIDWDLDMQAAFDLPRHVNRNGPIEIEEETELVRYVPQLEALGHNVDVKQLTSGLHGIRVTADGLDGGADRRREGVVLSTGGQ
jgi:gamma-glutamyltranspeptidase/glutathione hydrolase